MSFFSKLTEKVVDEKRIKNFLAEKLNATVSEISDNSGKIQDAVRVFNASRIILREAGFIVSDLKICMGKSPKIVASFDCLDTIDTFLVHQIRSKQTDVFVAELLNALVEMHGYKQALSIPDAEYGKIEIEIGTEVNINLLFKERF